ncbi:hypothetical protein AUJ66_05990 [Candidatus Desantisbacteria bacterium CG1_02_38_46]|uniref:Uncharacterized protein n=1 Tax=Candidatus Desantisbacteria bacterium CG1_02_38_46 TaxID=1817893 RepID=A0A1J4SCR8_9BACT|nr:MAG: hypothetical protein AUJ66_05990 [Candidatus Desantisbacteria bacterium CG1_02_38_46]
MNLKKLSILTIFGIAMGWWEGVVVVYIRKILQLSAIDLTKIVMEQVPRSLLIIEQTREVATIVILVTIALLLEKNWIRRLATFLWVFAIWDIFYYVTLKILINWPPSLSTIDCLFLIPCPWTAPVWIPLITMVGFLVLSGYIFKKCRADHFEDSPRY